MPIDTFTPEVYSKIVWGIYNRFEFRNKRSCRVGHGDKGIFSIDLVADIMLFILEHYDEFDNNEDDEIKASFDRIAVNVDNISDIKAEKHEKLSEIQGFLDRIKRKSNDESKKTRFKIVDKSGLDKFLKSSCMKDVFTCYQESIKTGNIPDIQLDTMCLYGWKMTFKQLKNATNIFYTRAGNIRLIPTDLDSIFKPPVISILEMLHAANDLPGATILREKALEMFARELQSIGRDFMNGIYRVEASEYLNELKLLMQKCQCGFGINVPKFDKFWFSPEGKEILLINKKQGEERLLEPVQEKYIRILFINGDKNSHNSLSEEENELIQIQLKHNVDVYVIFIDQLENSDVLEKLDFAVLKVDESPALMGTNFEGEDDTSGIFYIAEKVASEYCEKYLTPILKSKIDIYRPDYTEGKVHLSKDSPIIRMTLKGLMNSLSDIYSPNKYK